MSTRDTGSAGEDAAAVYLQALGFVILERNYRTPRCEIDIVARKNQRVYFVEVKYRRMDAQGGGFDYITPRKLVHMTRAAETWRLSRGWRGEVQLAAIEVAADYEVTAFIESLDVS